MRHGCPFHLQVQKETSQSKIFEVLDPAQRRQKEKLDGPLSLRVPKDCDATGRTRSGSGGRASRTPQLQLLVDKYPAEATIIAVCRQKAKGLILSQQEEKQSQWTPASEV